MMARNGTDIQFTGVDEMVNRLKALEGRTLQTVKNIAEYHGPKMEAAAKQDAKWVDRTGAARMLLHYTVVEENGKIVLRLHHGVKYGLALEVRNAGRFSIIFPTIQRQLPAIQDMLNKVFKR
jgi:hypothetical protein